jgi:hypothetical protein
MTCNRFAFVRSGHGVGPQQIGSSATRKELVSQFETPPFGRPLYSLFPAMNLSAAHDCGASSSTVRHHSLLHFAHERFLAF